MPYWCTVSGCLDVAKHHNPIEGGVPVRCDTHRVATDTLAPKPLCEQCGLTALFVPYSETVPRRCAAHRHPTDGTHRRRWCRHPGCAVLPSYAPPGEAPLYCIAHRKNGFVNVRSGRPEHRPKLRKVRPPAPPPIVYTYVPPWSPRTPNVKLWRAPLPPLIDIRTGRIIEDA